ncbi:MAG TPA: hypothetical protein VJP89_04570 [Pyrinomonadaceae bacterium]|nr:hypothetical protein [Pyrinomonadaceae bacterium]
MTRLISEQTEKQEKWEPVDGIVTPAASALVAEDKDGLTITLLFSQIVDGSDSDLCIKFGRVLAYSVYEEFAHPWETLESVPRLPGRWGIYFYPLLRINESRWIASLPDLQAIHPGVSHYRLLTLDQIIDVLCSKPPEVSWIPR